MKNEKLNDLSHYIVNINLFKVNNRNTRERCEMCSKLTIKYQNDVTSMVKFDFSKVAKQLH